MLNKPSIKKKPKIKTPIPTGSKQCACCGSTNQISIHHVFYGSCQRNLSSKYECVEWLCYECHQSCRGIHGGNLELDLKLKRKHQLRLMETMSMEKFISIFRRNYVE